MIKHILPILLTLIAFGGLSQESPDFLREEVMQHVQAGQYDKGLEILQNNIGTIADDTTGLFDALVNLALFKKDWQAIIDAYKPHHLVANEDTTALTLARFYSLSPAERISLGAATSLPFKPSVSGTPIVKVRLNGHKYRFWFDTGAGMTVLSSRTAARCRVKTKDSKGSAMAATGKTVGLGPGMIDSMSIGGLKVLNHACIVLDKKDLEYKKLGIRLLKIDGIIGWNLLQELDVTINDKARRIELAMPGAPGDGPRNFTWLEQPLISCTDTAGNDCLFFLDTGASTPGLYQAYVNKSDTGKTVKKTVTVGSAGGTVKMETLVFPRVKLNVSDKVITMKNVTVLPHAADDLFVSDGVLGISDFKFHTIRFNIKEGFFRID